MKPVDVARVQAYLRHAFSNNRIKVLVPAKRGAPVEVHIGDEFVGTLDEDNDEGERSWSLTVSILEEDLPKI